MPCRKLEQKKPIPIYINSKKKEKIEGKYSGQ